MKPPAPQRPHRRLAIKLLGIAFGSFAFGYALVPFYNVLCSITGLGDQTTLARRAVAQHFPVEGRGLLSQDRMLLLLPAEIRGRREPHHAGALHRRPFAAELSRPHHLVVHVL